MLKSILIHIATTDEISALGALVKRSARLLSRGYYSDVEIDAAIKHVFGVDSELVSDGSYFVAMVDGALAGCGGWSKRTTLFGGDRYSGRTSGLLDPATDPAKIRAFFISPDFARMGVGTAILHACETAARAAGFTQAELMATLPGVPFYEMRGYVRREPVQLDLSGVTVAFVPMAKSFSAAC